MATGSPLLLGDELLDAELLDESVQSLVLRLDVVDLNLGLLGDEVHLSLTLLL